MRVFVAGATGVAGKEAVRQLVSAGHAATGVARSAEKASLLERFDVERHVGQLGHGAFAASADRLGCLPHSRRGEGCQS